MKVVVELADTLVADFDVIDFLHTLTETSVELLDANAAGLMLADQHGNLQVVAYSSQESRMLELFELQHEQGPCLDAFHHGQPVTNIKPVEAQRRWPTFGAAVRDAGYTSVHAIPMRLRDQVIGAMNLFLARPGRLRQDDLDLARALADIATIGVLQQRALQEQELLAEQLQGALTSRVLIEQAKGVLAERHGVPLSQAFSAMRTRARHTGQPLSQLATRIIDSTPEDADRTLRPDNIPDIDLQ